MRDSIVFYLNGERCSITSDQASMMLADFLRYDQGLTGTKVVCAEGDCGACSVLRFFPADKTTDHNQNYYPINSCITPVSILDGSSLVTVEALEKDGRLHESQRAMVECHGSQCGFCTPGFVMALTGLVEKKLCQKETTITDQEAKNAMTGNLCRCTGYDAIIESAKDIKLDQCESLKDRFYSEAQEKDLLECFGEAVSIESKNYSFYAPKTIKEASQFLQAYPEARIIASSTDLGVVHNKRKIQLNKLLSLHLIEELYLITNINNTIKVGARVSLSSLRTYLKDLLPEFVHYLDIFASPQIKNIATLIGNVANASPIGDTPTALLALDAKIHISGINGDQVFALEDFFISYRKTKLEKDQIITAISFPIEPSSFFKLYKNSNRKDLDISTVNLGVYISKDKSQIRLAAGGVAATTIRFKKTEDFLIANKIDTTNIQLALQILHSEFSPLSDLRGSSSYRHMLVENFFKRSLKDWEASI